MFKCYVLLHSVLTAGGNTKVQITKENVNVLKPGMLAKVNGQLVRFVGFGNTYEVIFEPVVSTPLSGKDHYDLEWTKPRIVVEG